GGLVVGDDVREIAAAAVHVEEARPVHVHIGHEGDVVRRDEALLFAGEDVLVDGDGGGRLDLGGPPDGGDGRLDGVEVRLPDELPERERERAGGRAELGVDLHGVDLRDVDRGRGPRERVGGEVVAPEHDVAAGGVGGVE